MLGLDIAALDERDRAVLDAARRDGDVAVAGGRAVRAGAADPLAGHPFVAALEAAPFRPPSPAEFGVDPAELRELVRRGLVVEQDGVWFAPAAIDDAAQSVGADARRHARGRRGRRRRERSSDTTRKWAVPLLTILDSRGITRRRGDVRIAGPRLRAAIGRATRPESTRAAADVLQAAVGEELLALESRSAHPRCRVAP